MLLTNQENENNNRHIGGGNREPRVRDIGFVENMFTRVPRLIDIK